MIDALTNSMNQVSEDQKRLKRRAEIVAELNKLRRESSGTRPTGLGLQDLTGFERNYNETRTEALQRELDSLNY